MTSPRPTIVFKTLLFVFVAVFCLFTASDHGPSGKPEILTTATNAMPGAARFSSVSQISGTENFGPDLSNYRLATRWGRDSAPRFAGFASWATRYATSDPTFKAELVAEGVSLAKSRRAALQKLIRKQPKAALAEAVPVVVRNQLPEEVVALLEERVTGKGDLTVLARTDPTDGHATVRRALINGRNYDAYVFGERASQRTAQNISLHGVALDGEIALSDSPLRVFEEGEPVPADKPLAADSCPVSRQPTAPTKNGPRPNAVAAESGDRVYWMCHSSHVRAAADEVSAQEAQFTFQAYANTGPRSLLVMRVDFSDYPGESSSQATVQTTLNAVDEFLSENSYGDFHFSSQTITPVLRLPLTGQEYRNTAGGDEDLLRDARAAARSAGYETANYDFDIVTFSRLGFNWLGQGYVGLKGAWLQGSFLPGTAAHELGHNLGVWHANSWDASDTPISLNGFHEEYGNPFDVMGDSSNFPEAHYNANFKHLYGWLSRENITTVTNAGTYRIYAQDQNSRLSDRSYALNIPAAIYAGRELEDYWIDYRQLLSTRYPSTAAGAIVQWGNNSGSVSGSRLLDMNVSSPTKEDAPLALNNTFIDAELGWQITPIGQGGSGADAYLDIQIASTAPPVIGLAEALDTPTLPWSNSIAAWKGQRSTTHDGSDAASSPSIPAPRDNSESYIETKVTGPGHISFWWKVSSEESFDVLQMFIDGEPGAKISGELDWQPRSYAVSAGVHTIRWSYKKDGATSGGADRAWLDQVAFTPGAMPPFVNAQPKPVVMPAGYPVQFQVDAVGGAPLIYQWQRLNDQGELISIPFGTNSTLVLTNVQVADSGLYSCTVSNTAGLVNSAGALLTVLSNLPLPEALDNTVATWSTSGAIPWRGQTDITYDGIDAAQCGPIADEQESVLRATVTGPGTLTFWWHVSSEERFDALRFYLDGALDSEISGEVPWVQKTIDIPNGRHYLRWTYSKDPDASEGFDSAWVDQIQFQPAPAAPPTIVTHPLPQNVSLGDAAIFTAEYVAAAPVTFTWHKDGVPLTERPGVSGVHSDTLLIADVKAADVGAYSLQITNPLGQTNSLAAALQMTGSSLADALDTPGRAWLTGGDRPWATQSTHTHDALDAAATGSIDDEQVTWIETRATGPADVSFWWKASTELDYDLLTLEIDTEPVLKISGNAEWRRETVALTEGEHTLRWKFQKDADTLGGVDAAWLDQVQIITAQPSLPRIAKLSLDENVLNVRIESLPATGQVILETSSDLRTWMPITTNQITGSSMTIVRPAPGASEFLRVKTP